ncbi:MAG: FtsX-like permease family protein [Spirochaetales bacterium]|nr:FtsX-like permease family protein [Spirochaetales bacterium]
MKGPFFIAGRLFRGKKQEHGAGHPLMGAALGIALSLIPLVTVDHVADAMIEGIVARYRETSTMHFQAQSWSSLSQEQTQDVEQTLVNRPEIRDAWTERTGFGLARSEGSREGLSLRAVPANLASRDPSFSQYIEFDAGSWNLDSQKSILLGREAARRLGANLGDEIRVLTARRLADDRYIPRVSRFTVSGIFSSGYQDLDRTWAFISLEAGWKILSSESSFTVVSGKYSDLNQITPSVVDAINEELPPRWIFSDWRELNSSTLANLSSTRNILLVIMGLIIIVAVANATTSLMMLTIERRREVGMLKCMGTSPAQITSVFVAAGGLAALVGIAIGISGGLFVSFYVNEIIAGIEVVLGWLTPGQGVRLLDEGYYLQTIPIHIRWKPTALIGTLTLALSLAASALPASRAAGLKPLDVLRRH